MSAPDGSDVTEELWRAATAPSGSVGRRPSRDDVVHLVGIEEVQDALRTVAPTVTSTVESVVPYVPEPATLDRSSRAEEVVLGRGVALRSVMPTAARQSVPALRYARLVVPWGAQVRTGPVGRFRYVIFDGRVALVSENEGRTGQAGEALLVRSRALVASLGGQFETLWHQSVDLGPSAAGGESLSPRDARVLRGLALGLLDQEIAKAAGCSVATVERTTSRLRARWNVASRAALAIEAVRRGWGENGDHSAV